MIHNYIVYFLKEEANKFYGHNNFLFLNSKSNKLLNNLDQIQKSKII